MSSFPVSPIETLFSQPTSSSNATSTTAYSRVSFKSIQKAAHSFGLIKGKKETEDVEKQASAEEDEDDGDNGSLFETSGPNGTKVRTREFPLSTGIVGETNNFKCSRTVSNWLSPRCGLQFQ